VGYFQAIEFELTGSGIMSLAVRLALSLLCFAAVAWGVCSYPLPSWPLAITLLVYAAALWRWPALFLVVVPATLPALDLGVWTGWTFATESDLVVLTTLGLLITRQPPDRTDFWPGLGPGSILLLLMASTGISVVIGLTTPVTGAAFSSNPYLRPDNALRLAKPLAEVLALMPFMRRRHREYGDMATLLGWGMLAGAIAVAAEAMIERALFSGVLNFTSNYRIAAAFSSMNVGGGHIGAYVAMTLPFPLGVALAARSWLPLLVILAATVGAGYTLVVTFARTAYAAAIVGISVAALSGLALKSRLAGDNVRRVLALLLVVAVLAGVVATARSGFMRERLREAAKDLLVRQSNWRHFSTERRSGPLGVLFGEGLGTYPRLMLARGAQDQAGDYRLETSEGRRFLTITARSPLFIGQKISLPLSSKLRLTLTWRATTPNAVLGVLICEKLLLYSDNCRGQNIVPREPGNWEAASIEIPLAGLDEKRVLGMLRRPVEFSVFSTVAGTSVSVRDLSLVDDWGWEALANGDFQHGMNRWILTDDLHAAWRIFNLYLMLLFESGLLGLASFIALSGLAIAGGARALRRGEVMGAAVIGSVISFLISGLFDNVLEAPRLATIFLLICVTGLILWDRDGGGRIEPLEDAEIERY
jgi:hypothetical protein